MPQQAIDHIVKSQYITKYGLANHNISKKVINHLKRKKKD